MSKKYVIYINGFWSGFFEKNDANHLGVFENLFKSIFYPFEIEFTSDINSANVLLESIFSRSVTNAKPWLYKIQYSGETDIYPLRNYDLTLCSDYDSYFIIDFPLFVYYMHCNNCINKLIHRPVRTKVPSKFCCFIVSNGACQVRNTMFELLNRYKKVDSWGKFANNVGTSLTCGYWDDEYIQFLSDYKFIICFENKKIGTYSTEKIVNPYLANIIPIYWSSHHIKNIFNPDSMLFLENETLNDFVELINKVIELDNDDAKYLEYVNRPVFKDMAYFNSKYSMETLSKKISSKIRSDTPIQYFVIHYTPLVERKQHILQQLKMAGIENFTFIETKDKEVLLPEEIHQFKDITISEVSLFLKHIEVFKTCDDTKHIVVLEDDAILCDNFSYSLDKCLLQLRYENWDVLFGAECSNNHCKTSPGLNVEKTRAARGTCMYVLNCGVGKRLCNLFESHKSIACPVDWWFTGLSALNIIKTFWTEPTLVSQGSETELFKTSLRQDKPV